MISGQNLWHLHSDVLAVKRKNSQLVHDRNYSPCFSTDRQTVSEQNAIFVTTHLSQI